MSFLGAPFPVLSPLEREMLIQAIEIEPQLLKFIAGPHKS